MAYPTSAETFPTRMDGVTLVDASLFNPLQNEVMAISNQLISGKLAAVAAPTAGDKVLTITGGTPAWSAQAADSAKLGGQLPSAYLGATAQAADSAKLGGVAAANFVQIPTWTAYTPTISWAGGSTDPDAVAINYSKYIQIGKFVAVMIVVSVTRGSGDRSYIKFSLPTAVASAASGSCTHTLVTSAFTVAAVYHSSGLMTINFGTLSRDGYLWLSAFYEAS